MEHLLAALAVAWVQQPSCSSAAGFTRRSTLRTGAVVSAGWPFGGTSANAAAPPGKAGATNEVVATVNGIRQRRLGGSDLVVSEFGLGTQRWGSADFNAPDEELCHKMMDRAILGGGVNLIDTAEQYPIPSDRARPEGDTERIIGSWLAKDKARRQKVRRTRHSTPLIHRNKPSLAAGGDRLQDHRRAERQREEHRVRLG